MRIATGCAVVSPARGPANVTSDLNIGAASALRPRTPSSSETEAKMAARNTRKTQGKKPGTIAKKKAATAVALRDLPPDKDPKGGYIQKPR